MAGVCDVEMPVSIIIFQHPADNDVKNNSCKIKFDPATDLGSIRTSSRMLREKECELTALGDQERGSQYGIDVLILRCHSGVPHRFNRW